MKPAVRRHFDVLLERFPELTPEGDAIIRAFHLIMEGFSRDSTLFVAGNGGSCSDADHIVGELQKGFLSKRPLPEEDRAFLAARAPDRGRRLGEKLQQGLRAISLTAHVALMTAVINDIGGEYVMAQSLCALGRPGDVLLAISTSGNAEDVLLACDVARLRNMSRIGLSGKDGGRLKQETEVCIRVPATATFRIQEYHLPIYHTLCLMVEQALFPGE